MTSFNTRTLSVDDDRVRKKTKFNILIDGRGSRSDEEIAQRRRAISNTVFLEEDDDDLLDDDEDLQEDGVSQGRIMSAVSTTPPSSVLGFARSVSSISLNDPTLLAKIMNG